MKILLIKPPLNPRILTTSLYEPLELEYIAASVSDHDVMILDMRIDRRLEQVLKDFRPDIAGLTGYTSDYNNVVSILKRIRSFDKSIHTVVGGHHATFRPMDFYLPEVDAIFTGYADSTFPAYIRSMHDPEKLKEIPNLAILKGGNITFTVKKHITQDLDLLQLPSRSLIYHHYNKYRDPVRNRLALIMSSRGCPFRCNFCACWKLMDGKYTARSPESIIGELNSIPEKTKVVYFSDDNTFHDLDRMWTMSRLIRENGIRKKFQMYARADTIVKHPDLIADLKKAGLQFLTVGLESFSNSDLDYYNKKTSVEVNDRAIRILKKENIYILSHFIVRPEYTREDFKGLMEYVNRHNLFRPAFPVLTPLPGTEFYNETVNSFEITNFDYFDFAHSILPTRLERKEFNRRLSALYRKSFSPLRLIRHRINRLISRDTEKYYTDNTDGITLWRIILTDMAALFAWLKMRRAG